MKLFQSITLGALVLAGLTPSAFADDASSQPAGLFLEPAITYQTGEMKVTYPVLNDSTEKTNGFGLGLRLGFHVWDTLFIAADGRYAKPDYQSSAMGGSATSDLTNLGATLGVQTPLAGLRVWGTYIVTGSLDPQQIGSTDVKFNNPKGYRVGAGFYVAMVSLNFEYQEVKYDSVTAEKAPIFAGATTDSAKGNDKSYIVSVSFPIAL
jgi:hypothetical protein